MKKLIALTAILAVMAVTYCTIKRTLDFLPVQRAAAEEAATKVCSGGYQPVVDVLLDEETAKFPTYCVEVE